MRAGKQRRGFTLVEMLVTISIMVLIAALVIPLFSRSRELTRRSDATNAVRAALQAAREAAIQRRTVVALEFVSAPDPRRGDLMILVDKSDHRNHPAFDRSAVLADGTRGDPARRKIGQPIALPDFIKFDGNRTLPSGVIYTSPEWTLVSGWPGDANDFYDGNDLNLGVGSLLQGTVTPYPEIAYLPDGTVADEPGTTDIALVDTTVTARQVLRVLPATGLVIEANHLQDPSAAPGPTNPSRRGWL